MASRYRLFRAGIVVWGGGVAIAWVGGAAFRTAGTASPEFAFMLASGLVYGWTVGRTIFWTLGNSQAASAGGTGSGDGKIIYLHPWGEINQERGGRVAAAALYRSKGQRWTATGEVIRLAMVAAAQEDATPARAPASAASRQLRPQRIGRAVAAATTSMIVH